MDLAAYLKKHGITQTEFAARLGVTQGLVSQWLLGRTPITPKRARQIETETGGKVSAVDICPQMAELLKPIARKARATA